MQTKLRLGLCLGILLLGTTSLFGLERLHPTERTALRKPLNSLPHRIGAWEGRDVEMDPEIVRQSQASEYVNRTYESPRFPGQKLALWVNYSLEGLNMRHSPEICLPSGGWKKIESATSVLALGAGDGKMIRVSRLGYGQGELVQGIGFWYYIFGESRLEHWVRTLPITSRSSHGRTTRGSGLTVEVFWPGDLEKDSPAFRDFAAALLRELEPILPADRDTYHVP